MAEAPSPFSETAAGVAVRVRLTPKAGRNAVQGLAVDGAGRAHVKAAVTAVPEKGKANQALLKLLAKEWQVGMGRLSLITGAKDRNKTVEIAGDAPALKEMLADWLAGLDGRRH